ncbi:BTB/POZ domain-containing protein KCTD8-like isoform X2 [Leucoraja erinacea]|uniref:BTB/POZ domain-containing protein KCTD8-like isoform X2 n=1 Tax=Leucoraja erinaceus TaxID=7782 RepID=UPI002457BD75|nr:BTB/POZ domain-containing protein KCTD8-like isoform X2 [Leucoraja erinacea]XP_055499747.1 BTB/POZ domain-containing protein KCTD8-like isoform X2 [Leucoraja erinacea]
MCITNHLSSAVEETAPDVTIFTEEHSAVNETIKDAEDNVSCHDVSTSSLDCCSEANTGSKPLNENSHELLHQSSLPEQDSVQDLLKAEDKDFMNHSHHSDKDESISVDLAGVAEEQNNKVIEPSNNTEDVTSCNDIATSNTESCSIINSGSEIMTKSLPEPPQRATTLELEDVQRIQHEDKILHQQKISKRTNTNQGSFDKATDLDRNKSNEEKQTLEAELQKCVEDLKKIKIPSTFLKKQRHWQNELLKKYDM